MPSPLLSSRGTRMQMEREREPVKHIKFPRETGYSSGPASRSNCTAMEKRPTPT